MALFGDVKVEQDSRFVVTVDDDVARLNIESGDVESDNAGLKNRIENALRRLRTAAKPIPLSIPES